MAMKPDLSLRKIPRFLPPAEKRISLIPTDSSPVALPGVELDPAIVYEDRQFTTILNDDFFLLFIFGAAANSCTRIRRAKELFAKASANQGVLAMKTRISGSRNSCD